MTNYSIWEACFRPMRSMNSRTVHAWPRCSFWTAWRGASAPGPPSENWSRPRCQTAGKLRSAQII